MSDQLTVINFIEQLKGAQTDPVVGIRIIKVTGNDPMGLYVAELAPHHSITAHYHRAGSEIYQIVQGDGKIHTGVLLPDDKILWNISLVVHGGDCFTVHEGEVHRLEKTGSLPLLALIICPAAHIGHDRFTVRGAIP